MSFFKNLSVGERVEIEAQLVEWSKQMCYGGPRVEPNSWTINDDLTVDVDGDIWLGNLDFEKLPVKFGKVTRSFSIWSCKNLTTLEGAPKEVGWNFFCDECLKLTSLEGAPKKVGKNFYAYGCSEKFTEAKAKNSCKVT